MQLFDLSGRTALVTGGNGGIGLGMARGLAEAGANLVLVGRDADKGAVACAELEALGAAACFVAADVTDEAAVAGAVAAAVEAFGGLDIVVNNAGMALRKPPQDYSLADWHVVLDGNLTSAFLVTRAAYPHFRAAGGGKVVNIASIMALLGAPFTVAYSASKSGLVGFTRALAAAWAADNVQVNAILPGWVDTDLTVAARNEVPGLNEKVLARVPAGRWGRPRDFSGAAVFLCSGASDFVTGATLLVDGGYAAQA